MSPPNSTVSALKYRPSRFSDVLAQDHVTQTLKNSLRRDQIANAFLFVGSRGTGKTTTARILAKALNCDNLQEGEPCNQCDSCLAVQNQNHSDVLEIDAASNRGIDEIRTLRENVRFTPTLGRYKVYIIDEVHMLTDAANNAFLKTLEEPPSHVCFILATTELHKILPTILSRCQRFQFRRIPSTVIVEHLKTICEQEKIEFETPGEQERILFQVARKSEGGLRDAFFFLDQLVSFCSGKLSLALVEDALGVIEFDMIDRYVSAIFQHDLPVILETVETISNRGGDFNVFLKECLHHLRNLAVVKVSSKQTELLDLPDEYKNQLQESAQGTSLEQILYVTDVLWEAERRLFFSSDARLVLEMISIKAAKAGQAIKVEDVLKNLENLSSTEFASVPAPTTPASPQKENTAATTPAPSREAAPAAPQVQSESPVVETLPEENSSDETSTLVNASETKEVSEVKEVDSAEVTSSVTQIEPQAVEQDSPAVNHASLFSIWKHFLHEIDESSKVSPIISVTLSDCVPLELKENTLRIGLPTKKKFHLTRLKNQRISKTITNLLEEAFGKTLTVEYEIRDDLDTHEDEFSQETGPTQAEPTKKELLDKVQQDKIFNKLMDELPGKILYIKPHQT